MQPELIWAGGLFEGEGCITASGRGDLGVYPHLSMTTTDEDVARRFAAAVGVGSLTGPYSYTNRPAHFKPRWTWTCSSWADIEALVPLLWPWLGERRRARVQEVVERAEAAGLGRRRAPWVSKPWQSDVRAAA